MPPPNVVETKLEKWNAEIATKIAMLIDTPPNVVKAI